MVSLVGYLIRDPPPSLSLRAAPLHTPGAPAAQSGCTTGRTAPNRPEGSFCGGNNHTVTGQSPLLRVAVAFGEFVFNFNVKSLDNAPQTDTQ